MEIKVELKTKNHNEYSEDKVVIENDGEDFIEFKHYGNFSLRKSDLKRVLKMFCEE